LAGRPPTGNNGYAFRDSGRTVKTPTMTTGTHGRFAVFALHESAPLKPAA
jgi:hypothetical protein